MVSFVKGCSERHDPFKKDPAYFTAFRSLDYGYTRMTVHNSTHLYMDQVSIDQVWERNTGNFYISKEISVATLAKKKSYFQSGRDFSHVKFIVPAFWLVGRIFLMLVQTNIVEHCRPNNGGKFKISFLRNWKISKKKQKSIATVGN